MKFFSLVASLIFIGAAQAQTAQERTLGERIIKRMQDEWERKIEFRAEVEIAAYERPDTQPSLMTLTVFGVNRQEQSDSLALVLAPTRDKGRIFLNKNNRYWAYFPNIKRSTTLSPLAVVSGDVSSGDLLAPPPLQLYRAEIVREQDNKVQLRLSAKDRDAPYGRIDQFYLGMQLVRAQLYARSGVLLKETEYSEYSQNALLGYPLAGLLRIVNKVEEGRVSLLRFSNMQAYQTPESWFNPNNLSAVRG